MRPDIQIVTEKAASSHPDSEKLANGKVKGTVPFRVPPERLDTWCSSCAGWAT